MSQRETYRTTLTYALAIAGSEHALAVRLNITMPQLMNYLWGIEVLPDSLFLRAVDVVLESTAEEIRNSRQTLNALKRPKPDKDPPPISRRLLGAAEHPLPSVQPWQSRSVTPPR